MEELYTLLEKILEAKALTRLVCSRSKDRSVEKVSGRIIELRGLRTLQLETFTSDGKARQKNLPENTALPVLLELVQGFRQINLFTTAGECEIRISKNGACHFSNRIKDPLTPSPAGENNKEHHYLLDPVSAAPFLSKLGVCDEKGRIFDKKSAKFKQINRFVEILDDCYSRLPQEGTLTVCDLCCGKSYLTFAVYYYLTTIRRRKVKMYGVDLKKDVMDFCRETAAELGFESMEFFCKDISDFHPSEKPDLVISLHACDIATDLALATALRARAKYIACVPCCHKELLDQYTMPGLEPLTRHGVFKARFNDVLTDSMRALKLEAEGYKVSVVEYISPLDTPKNLLIRAVRTGRENRRAKADYEAVRRTLGTTSELDRRCMDMENEFFVTDEDLIP